ncbi:MAG: bifunctional riboflavin kinase/FMN adenylyltransferase [Clostridiales bacterium]|nr:bifunctional riboflavin kinase/FMN adenylyltransferase [Clostridiales bacterium]
MDYIHDTTDFNIEEIVLRQEKAKETLSVPPRSDLNRRLLDVQHPFYQSAAECNPEWKLTQRQGTAITLGKFDGLHRGHQKLLDEILRLQMEGYYGIVFAIAPENQTSLFTAEEKQHMLEAYGVDCLIRCPFVPEILSMEPERFIADVLCAQLHARWIVVGTDFRFGYQRKGDVEFLRSMQEKYGYTLLVIEKERYREREISSTYIREALSGADMQLVRTLMGDFYPVEGTVLHGHQLGRKIGMPTINLRPEPYKLLPPPGVYYSDVVIFEDIEVQGQSGNCALNAVGNQEASNTAGNQMSGSAILDTHLKNDRLQSESGIPRILHGITNIGYKPTVDGTFLGVETYLYGVCENLYGRKVKVLLREFRRPEQKFESVEELKAQMEKDIQAGKEYFEIR